MSLPPPLELTDPDEPDEELSPSELADRLFVRLTELAPCQLSAELESNLPEQVEWLVTRRGGSESQRVASIEAKAFRTVLARIGYHFMNEQLYGGYVQRDLVWNGRSYRTAIYLSNEGFTGFWVKAFMKPPADQDT